ncbi:MAG: hypothetical protein WAT39_19400 [Planctomycetota bacterium]
MAENAERNRREIERLRQEVALAAKLTDAERVEIMADLWQFAELIRATKSEDQLRREEIARQILDGPGMERYRALAARLAGGQA